MNKIVTEKITTWLSHNYDEKTKAEIRRLVKEDPEEIVDSFYKNLEFGTGGLRGVMGVGTNRINKYTVASTTQGFANHLLKSYVNQHISVAVAYDSRNNSTEFSRVAAEIFAANGIKVYLFEALRPTPELSFAIRYLKCQGGVVVTASHNPKEYSGYKVYGRDGAQIIPPDAEHLIEEVSHIADINQINFRGRREDLIEPIGAAVDEVYLAAIEKLSLAPEAIRSHCDLKIVFTSIHGTGITLVPDILKRFGFTQVYVVKEQAEPDGNFPTVVYPNPEEAEALHMALEKSKQIDADILLGTDPDSDRVGIGVKNHRGDFQLLNGNQTAVLLFYYLITRRKEKGLTSSKDFIAKTIVTTELIDKMAQHNGVACENTLTGFKYIAALIRNFAGERNFVAGCEESYGYMIGDFVRDKDAISAVAMICEMAAYAKNNRTTVFDTLLDIYVSYGFYKEKLMTVTKKGERGAEEIQAMMIHLRENPPMYMNGSPLVELRDYSCSIAKNFAKQAEKIIDLPSSNVLQFILEDGSIISARPSGTEPKIKFYFSVNAPLVSKEQYDVVANQLDEKIERIIRDLGL